MKQTAVSWLISELKKSKDFQRVINEVNQSSTAVRDILKEAEDMEKEQLEITFYKDRLTADVEIGLPINWEFEQYYYHNFCK